MFTGVQQAYLPSQSSTQHILPLSKAWENCITIVLFCVNFSVLFKFLIKKEEKHHRLINLVSVMDHKPPNFSDLLVKPRADYRYLLAV